MAAANQSVRVEAFGTEGGKVVGPGEILHYTVGAYVWVGNEIVALLSVGRKGHVYIPEKFARKTSGWGKE